MDSCWPISSSAVIHYCVLEPCQLRRNNNTHTIISSYKVCKVFAFAQYFLLRLHDGPKKIRANETQRCTDGITSQRRNGKIIRIRVSCFFKLFEKRARRWKCNQSPAYLYIHMSEHVLRRTNYDYESHPNQTVPLVRSLKNYYRRYK